MEVQLHVDVRMRQKAGTQTTKIKSAKSFVEVHPRKCIPSKYTCYTVCVNAQNSAPTKQYATLGLHVYRGNTELLIRRGYMHYM